MIDNGTACLISALRFRIHIQTIASTIPILQVESNHAIRPILCRLTGGLRQSTCTALDGRVLGGCPLQPSVRWGLGLMKKRGSAHEKRTTGLRLTCSRRPVVRVVAVSSRVRPGRLVDRGPARCWWAYTELLTRAQAGLLIRAYAGAGSLGEFGLGERVEPGAIDR